jgi:spermidine synthase
MWRETGFVGGKFVVGSCLVLLVFAAGLVRRGRQREMTARVFLAGVAGLSGLVLEVVVLLHYQIQAGILYRDLGLLFTAFMVGLTLGGALLSRNRQPGRRTGFVILAGLTLLAVSTAWVTAAGLETGLSVALGLVLAAGTLTAALLGYASRYRLPREQPLVGPLFAADLLGGSLGSVAATLLLIPLWGLPATSAALLIPILVAALVI